MSQNILKAPASIRIDAYLLEQIKKDAQMENRSLSNYIETLLYRFGYRPYNKETIETCKEYSVGVVDTTSQENFIKSILGNEKND